MSKARNPQKSTNIFSATILFLSVLLLISGCAKSGDDTSTDSSNLSAKQLSIAGQYSDNYGGDHLITPTSWSMMSGAYTFEILQVDESTGYLIAKNGASNAYDPNLFSRFDFQKQSDGRILYCQTAYNANSLDAAKNFSPANFQAANTNGCGGFAFSILSPATIVKATIKNKARDLASAKGENSIPRRGPDSIKNKK